jgi:hypothetical protein
MVTFPRLSEGGSSLSTPASRHFSQTLNRQLPRQQPNSTLLERDRRVGNYLPPYIRAQVYTLAINNIQKNQVEPQLIEINDLSIQAGEIVKPLKQKAAQKISPMKIDARAILEHTIRKIDNAEKTLTQLYDKWQEVENILNGFQKTFENFIQSPVMAITSERITVSPAVSQAFKKLSGEFEAWQDTMNKTDQTQAIQHRAAKDLIVRLLEERDMLNHYIDFATGDVIPGQTYAQLLQEESLLT